MLRLTMVLRFTGKFQYDTVSEDYYNETAHPRQGLSTHKINSLLFVVHISKID